MVNAISALVDNALGDDYWKWRDGAMTDSGVIYCFPWDEGRGILKIDTNTDVVTEMDRNLLPEQGRCLWRSCATAFDKCIYFMPGAQYAIVHGVPGTRGYCIIHIPLIIRVLLARKEIMIYIACSWMLHNTQ